MTVEKLEACPSFDAKYIPEPNSGCWLWIGSTNGKRGYGKMFFNGRLRLAHAVSYELHKGTIPEGLTIDHDCRTRLCVNPDHLNAMTQKENNLRGDSPTAVNKRKDCCPKGHSLDGDNVRVSLRKDGAHRHCRQCNREWKQQKRRKS